MRAALITGAGRRIGSAIARDLAANGWHVLLHCHRSAPAASALRLEIEAAGGACSVLVADLANETETLGLIERATAAAPELELLVNNAATFADDSAMTTTSASLHANFAVNAVAPIILATRLAAALAPGRVGVVVNILDNRVFAPNPDHFSYGVSKFAALGATRTLALALAPRVRVNAIAPGITLPSGGQTQAEFEAAHRINPLGKGCSPEEVAAAVRLIAGSPAMTGAVITIDGGLALANPGRDVSFIETERK